MVFPFRGGFQTAFILAETEGLCISAGFSDGLSGYFRESLEDMFGMIRKGRLKIRPRLLFV